MASKQKAIRILFLLPDFPYPPSTGGRLKIFNELTFLSERHQCDILCFGAPTEQQRSDLLKVLPKINILDSISLISGYRKVVAMLRSTLSALPPSFAAFSSEKYRLAMQECLLKNSYDVVHYDIVNMAQYLPLGINLPSVHSPNDATSLVYFRVAKSMNWSLAKLRMLVSALLLRRFERKMYPLFSKVHIVSKTDAEYLKCLDTKIDTSVIPITVDDNFLAKVNVRHKKNDTSEFIPKIICTGNLGNPAIAQGVDSFLQVAFPSILQKTPNTKFVILGQNIKPDLQKKIAENANVEFLSWVADYRSFLTEADIVLVPDCSGPPGAKTRAVQAMGIGLPVVGTESAFDGIPLTNGKHALIYTTMDECATLILKLIDDKKMREKLGENANLLVIQVFALSTVGASYESLYLDAISKHKSLMYNSNIL